MLDPNIVFRNPHNHISALSDINNLIVQLDTVDAWVFVFAGEPLPAKHGTNILYILVLHSLPPFIFVLHIYYNKNIMQNQNIPVELDFSKLFVVFRA